MQFDGDTSADRYFYLHDRHGSVRQLINTIGYPVNRYTYGPFGQRAPPETEETVENPFQFTGQFYDAELDQCQPERHVSVALETCSVQDTWIQETWTPTRICLPDLAAATAALISESGNRAPTSPA